MIHSKIEQVPYQTIKMYVEVTDEVLGLKH
jgi:hypothetical protein